MCRQPRVTDPCIHQLRFPFMGLEAGCIFCGTYGRKRGKK